MTTLNQEHNQTVVNILRTVLKLGSETDITTLTSDSLDSWDSMAQVNIVAALESEFDLFIETEDAEGMTSFDAICNYLIEEL